MTIKVCDKCKTPIEQSKHKIRFYLPTGIDGVNSEINIHINFNGKRKCKSELCSLCVSTTIQDFLKVATEQGIL